MAGVQLVKRASSHLSGRRGTGEEHPPVMEDIVAAVQEGVRLVVQERVRQANGGGASSTIYGGHWRRVRRILGQVRDRVAECGIERNKPEVSEQKQKEEEMKGVDSCPFVNRWVFLVPLSSII